MVYSLSTSYANSVADRYNEYGYCLKQVRTWWGIGSKYGTANGAWTGAALKHTSGTPPKGACVFYTGGKYGHIAYSLGNGYVRSTDVAGRGRVGTVPTNWFAKNWGYHYRGWTGDLNGVKLPLVTGAVSLPRVDLSLLVEAARTNPPMATNKVTYSGTIYVERALKKMGYDPGTVDGHYGTACKTAYAAWQRRCGYSGTSANGIPGMTTLTALGRRSGLFTVVA